MVSALLPSTGMGKIPSPSLPHQAMSAPWCDARSPVGTAPAFKAAAELAKPVSRHQPCPAAPSRRAGPVEVETLLDSEAELFQHCLMWPVPRQTNSFSSPGAARGSCLVVASGQRLGCAGRGGSAAQPRRGARGVCWGSRCASRPARAAGPGSNEPSLPAQSLPGSAAGRSTQRGPHSARMRTLREWERTS